MQSDFSLERALDQILAWRAQGKRIVFTNGVFDILHLGHVTYLEQARSLGDILVVGVNDDASVRRLGKGPERPINPEKARAAVIESLKAVDASVVFSEDTPAAIIGAIAPDVLVKGGDYDPQCADPSDATYMVGREVVLKNDGQVVAIPLVEGFSTSSIVRRMRADQ